jgi:hypothetical protein
MDNLCAKLIVNALRTSCCEFEAFWEAFDVVSCLTSRDFHLELCFQRHISWIVREFGTHINKILRHTRSAVQLVPVDKWAGQTSDRAVLPK